VSSCLQGLDVLVMPSNFEGMPLALLEAMAAGICCCASDVDGMAEAIDHGLTGYLCAPGNLNIWCRQLEALIGDPRLRAAVGSRARDVACRRFGVENMAKNTVSVYEDVVRSYCAL
jgi:glycosyltransferase involved in cell wall biosynthesis